MERKSLSLSNKTVILFYSGACQYPVRVLKLQESQITNKWKTTNLHSTMEQRPQRALTRFPWKSNTPSPSKLEESTSPKKSPSIILSEDEKLQNTSTKLKVKQQTALKLSGINKTLNIYEQNDIVPTFGGDTTNANRKRKSPSAYRILSGLEHDRMSDNIERDFVYDDQLDVEKVEADGASSVEKVMDFTMKYADKQETSDEENNSEYQQGSKAPDAHARQIRIDSEEIFSVEKVIISLSSQNVQCENPQIFETKSEDVSSLEKVPEIPEYVSETHSLDSSLENTKVEAKPLEFVNGNEINSDVPQEVVIKGDIMPEIEEETLKEISSQEIEFTFHKHLSERQGEEVQPYCSEAEPGRPKLIKQSETCDDGFEELKTDDKSQTDEEIFQEVESHSVESATNEHLKEGKVMKIILQPSASVLEARPRLDGEAHIQDTVTSNCATDTSGASLNQGSPQFATDSEIAISKDAYPAKNTSDFSYEKGVYVEKVDALLLQSSEISIQRNEIPTDNTKIAIQETQVFFQESQTSFKGLRDSASDIPPEEQVTNYILEDITGTERSEQDTLDGVPEADEAPSEKSLSIQECFYLPGSNQGKLEKLQDAKEALKMLRDLIEEIQVLKEENGAKDVLLEDLQEEITGLNEEKANKEALLSTLREENRILKERDLKERVSEYPNQPSIVELREENQFLKNTNEWNQEQQDKMMKSIKSLQNREELMKVNNDILKKEILALEIKIREMQVDMDTMKDAYVMQTRVIPRPDYDDNNNSNEINVDDNEDNDQLTENNIQMSALLKEYQKLGLENEYLNSEVGRLKKTIIHLGGTLELSKIEDGRSLLKLTDDSLTLNGKANEEYDAITSDTKAAQERTKKNRGARRSLNWLKNLSVRKQSQ